MCAALASEESDADEEPLPTAKLGATSGVVGGGCCASRTEILEGPLSSATVAGVGTGLPVSALPVCAVVCVFVAFRNWSVFFASTLSGVAGLMAGADVDRGCPVELSAVVEG